MDRFPNRSSSNILLFDKSSSYFANSAVSFRIKAITPKARLIIILDDPARRAYSFYQVLWFSLGASLFLSSVICILLYVTPWM